MFYRHLSIHRRVTPVAVITDMKRCETPQILHHQIKCCGDLIVLKTNIVTAQVTIRPKMCILRVREREGGTSYSPQENSHNHSALHSSNSHSSNPSNNPSKTSDAPYDSADDWSEHIRSSGKNITTIVGQKFHNRKKNKRMA